ncbi:MAG TPA: TetR/AcrR family transcriptional regulator [Vicinamibacterales bacterium]|nr:TetR/AcrR family transcriptional regulator [Vicinamibacterales bacterium]
MPRASRHRPAPDSRSRIFAAAAAEFAARGYAGASVDRIARAARLNKAMIYYHFRSKAALYRAILRDTFDAIGERARAVAAAPLAPDAKVRAYIELFVQAADARPHFAPIWLREVTDGATHVDRDTLAYAGHVLGTLAGILREGERAGRFRPVSPALVQMSIVAPLMLFLVTGPMRRKLDRAGGRGAAALTRAQVVAHIERVTLAVLEGRIA